MPFALNRIINLEDFREPLVRETIREIFAKKAAKSPEFPTGQENRKDWEVAMAVLALRDGGALRPDAEVLGIGAGTEATVFWLTNHVARVWATDLYANPGQWEGTATPTMLIDPGSAWDEPWNPRHLVVQHMDACELAYEDETFDAIFSSGSVEHFGSLERISTAMDEAFRVLKPGGTASFSTEFLIKGNALEYEDQLVMFTPELIERVLVGSRDWRLVTPIDYTLSDSTVATEVEIDAYVNRTGPMFPHCVLRIAENLLTSVHIALRKPARTVSVKRAAPPNGRAAVSGPRAEVAALTAHLPDPVVALDAGCSGGFPPEWEELDEGVKLIGFDPNPEECERLVHQYAGRAGVTLVQRGLGATRGPRAYRRLAFPMGSSLYNHADEWKRPLAYLDSWNEVQDIVEIELDTIDDWCRENGVDRIDVLKLDVQGHELEILRGAASRLADVRAVDVEVWLNPVLTGAPLYGEIDGLLREHGFALWRLGDLAYYPVVGAEGAPGSTENLLPFGSEPVVAELPSGPLCWANARFVRSEIFDLDSSLPWSVRLRDAVIMNGLRLHDLALISLRRLLDEDAPEDVAAAVRKVLAEPYGGPPRSESQTPDVREPSPAISPASPVRRVPGHSASAFLRRLAQVLYHPILWRLNRNYNQARLRHEELDSRLGDMQQKLADVNRTLFDMRRGFDNSSDTIASAQQVMKETREASDSSQQAIGEWSAIVARELDADGVNER
jgi:FkbM family methyltransferase